MKFPGTVSFLTASAVVAAVASTPYVAGILSDAPRADDEVRMAVTQMIAEPLASPEEPPIVVARRESRPPESDPAVTIEPSPEPPATGEPAHEQVARLDPVGSFQPVTAPPKQMDLAEKLPDEAKRTFELLLSEGNRLHDARETTPAYAAVIPVDMADRLIGQGIFRSGVTQGDRRLFVFAEGGLSDARSPRLAGSGDTQGFSSRVIALDRRAHASLVAQVATKFGISSGELTPCLLVRAQLDRVVLATQHRAATRQGLALSDLAYTTGRFECAAGIPFVYSIQELRGKDGQRIYYSADSQSVGASAQPASLSGGIREATRSSRESTARVPGA